MSAAHSLNDLYDQYLQGLLERKEFEGLLVKAILDDPKYFNLYNLKRDDCLDYLSWLYPRISRAIDSYVNNGATFESYIGSLIRLSAKEYRLRDVGRDVTEHAVWVARLPDTCVREEEPDYQENSQITKCVKNPRQLLILILKCYYYLSDDFLDRMALRLGMDKEQLKQMVDNLRRLRIQRDETTRLMRERIHSQFYRCMVYEKKLQTLQENTALHSRTKLQLQKARCRLETMRKRLAKIRLGATNMQIARILGVSKGTVDSNLYALKNNVIRREKESLPGPPAGSYNP